jgi:Holliday junction resolvase RusA-like endonuclease
MEYDPQEKQKKTISWTMTTQLREAFNSKDKTVSMEPSRNAFAASLAVEMTFYMPIPASTSNKRLNRLLWGLAEKEHNTKPDLSNLIKMYEDAGNGIIFADDKQIVDITAKKRYSLNPRTEITVMPKKPLDIHETADAILQTLSPCEFRDLMEITHELSLFANLVDQDPDLDKLQEDPNHYRKQLTKAALLISELAERYASFLSTIKKKYPKFNEIYHQPLCDQI